jgi:hypothetical protein
MALAQSAFQDRSQFCLVPCRWSQRSFEFPPFAARELNVAVALIVQCCCGGVGEGIGDPRYVREKGVQRAGSLVRRLFVEAGSNLPRAERRRIKPGRQTTGCAAKAGRFPGEARTRTSGLVGEGKARTARTTPLPDYQQPTSNHHHPTSNHQHQTTDNIPHPTNQYQEFAARPAVGHSLPGNRDGAASEGSQPPNTEENS